MCSPSVAIMAVGAAVSIMGQMSSAKSARQAAAVRQQQMQLRQAQLKNAATAVDQEIAAEQGALDQRLLANHRAGEREKGLLDVGGAARGVLLLPRDTWMDLKEELTGEITHKGLMLKQKSLLFKRNAEIRKGNILADIQMSQSEASAFRIGDEATQTKYKFGMFNTALGAASKSVGPDTEWPSFGGTTQSATQSAFNQDVSTLGAF